MTPSELEAQVRSLWNFDDPVASLELMDAAAAGACEPERSIWRTQTARALGLQERYAEADEILDQIDTGQSGHVRARVAIERGRVHNSRGDPEKARPWFEEALREAEAAGTEGLAIDAIHMLAGAVLASAGGYPPRRGTLLEKAPRRGSQRDAQCGSCVPLQLSEPMLGHALCASV